MTTPFISLTDLGTAIDRDLADDDAAIIAIDSACEMVRGYLRQFVNLVTDDEVTLSGTGTTALLLPERPVRSVTSVYEITIDSDGVETETEVEDTDYAISDSGILWRTDGAVWARGRANYDVVYSHGWDLTEDVQVGEDVERVPSDLRRVALEAATRLYEAGKLPAEVAAQIGEYSESYTSMVAGRPLGVAVLLSSEKVVLDRYREPTTWTGVPLRRPAASS